MATGILKKCALHGWTPVTTVIGRWQGIVWASGLLMSTLWTEYPIVAVGVWYGQVISYRQWTQLHFIDGNLNAQRYHDEILRPIVVPFIRRHHLMFQHYNAQPHVARTCTEFLEAENVPVLPWPAYSPGISSIVHVWDALDLRVRQRGLVPHQYPATLHSHWKGSVQHSTGHNQQPDQFYVNCMRQLVVTPDTDWFSGTRPYFCLKVICIPSHRKAID